MIEVNDGGPAFPNSRIGTCDGETAGIDCNGMSLRDWFAGRAMQGLIASNDEGAGDRIDEVPGYAYAIADAMLRAREQSTT
jgi:hypothetical protein